MLAPADPVVEPVDQPLPGPVGGVLFRRAPRPATSASISLDDEIPLLLDPAGVALRRQPVGMTACRPAPR